MRRLAIAALVTSLFTIVALAQKQPKPWGEWSQKDAQKILDDSPWGQTQTDTDTSQMFFSPTNDPGVTRAARATSTSGSRTTQGATNQAVNVNYRIRFFTAKPIRQAFVRLIQLTQSNLPKATAAGLEQFANLHSNEWIILAVAFDATDQRFSGPVMQAFGSATTAVIRNNTYLERKDGKKVFLSEYAPPGKDGSGAKFVFPRVVDERPFLTTDSGEVRCHTEFSIGSSPIKLDRRFKIADMMYDGQLEY